MLGNKGQGGLRCLFFTSFRSLSLGISWRSGSAASHAAASAHLLFPRQQADWANRNCYSQGISSVNPGIITERRENRFPPFPSITFLPEGGERSSNRFTHLNDGVSAPPRHMCACTSCCFLKCKLASLVAGKRLFLVYFTISTASC